MTDSMVSLEVDPSMVTGIIEKQIQAAIVAQLGNQDKLIERAVKLALSQKVNREGKLDSYSSYNKHDFLEILAGNSVRAAATEALREWLKENSIKIKKAVIEEMETPNRQRSIATAYADAIEDSIKCKFSMKCDIRFTENEEY